MVDADTVAYNVAVFLTALFLLEFGADKFIDHTAIVARRTGISETLVGLVTAGGEWEELIVIIASLSRNRASLAIGNIIGSAISNILGAFSLGLLFCDKHEPIHFDQSSRIYSFVLLVLTTFTIPIMYIPTKTTSLVGGSILIVSFAFYIASVGWAISRGALTAPEDSEEGGSSDSDDSSDGGSSTNDIVVEGRHEAEGDNHNFIAPPRLERNGQTTPLLNPGSSVMHSLPGPSRRKQRHTLAYHIFYLILGFLAICIAGYVLSHAATTIIDELNIPDVLFGVVVLAIATTLPEKFIAVMSGHRGHTGVLVANTAGSNIFLLTLCNGIILLNTKGSFEHGSVGIVELGVLWASTIAFAGTIWFGARFFQWIGYAMIATYITFIVLESTIL